MPKKTFNRLDIDKQETVMRAAVREFLTNGFDKCKVSVIADSAGIAKGSIYQYFENKRELFLYAVRWSLDYYIKKIDRRVADPDMDLFDYLRNNTPKLDVVREERELTLFIQNVFLGKYHGLADESMEEMMRISDEYVLRLIRAGKQKGTVRTDIDDHMLSLFLLGASIKIKEYWLSKFQDFSQEVTEGLDVETEIEVNAFIELLKNGMGT